MDPQRGALIGANVRLPRSGGDGPYEAGSEADAHAAAPLRRGWTPSCVQSHSRVTGCPAQAGMDPPPAWAPSSWPWLPRSGGDGPCLKNLCRYSSAAAPLRRGWTHRVYVEPYGGGGCPAQAGMDPGCVRDCGPVQRAAPLRRGWTPCRHCRRLAGPGCPAQAGMDPLRPVARLSMAWLPRSGGDGPNAELIFLGTNAAAPLRRRWPPLHRHGPVGVRGCPAQAGMDPLPPPRISSHLGCPAQAGMDRTRAAGRTCSSRLPRSGGEGLEIKPLQDRLAAAAPLRRGWTQTSMPRRHLSRGCPPRAGMDRQK